MMKYSNGIFLLLVWVLFTGTTFPQTLQRVSHNNPDLLVDLGVGLWAWPIPMDYDDDGLSDLVVVCTDKPYNGVYFFKNSGIIDSKNGLPVFNKAVRLGDAKDNVSVTWLKGEPFVTTPGFWYPRFKETALKEPVAFPAPDAESIHPSDGRVRANQWKVIEFDGDGVRDLLVGLGYWGEYGWDDAYNEYGQWTNGPLHGYLYLLKNNGTNAEPEYSSPQQLKDTDGASIDVFGRPSPNFADFTGDGKPDLVCGEFRDGFTFYHNVGSTGRPLFAPGRSLTNGDQLIEMHLCMITPVAYDFNGDGWLDLVVGDEDGRVALVEHTGKVVDEMPLFLPPRYFRQQAADVKFGALATPYGFDWNGDGRDDIIIGNTAGHIGFIENLGGTPTKWAAPERLRAGGEVIRIMAGPNGSIQGPAEAKWGYTTQTVADWNHDGLPDLVVNSIWGKVVWYENIGTRIEPVLAGAQPVTVDWQGLPPKPAWNWWQPEGNALVTQWRTTPVAVDWTGDGLTDLVMLDHDGYLALFRRDKRNDALILHPGQRVFRLEDEAGPWRLNDRDAGGSGRRKIAIVDLDSDGRLDLLINSENATFYRNVAEENGLTVFRDLGLVDERKLAGHTSSPATIDLEGDGVLHILIGAEDGYLYHRVNPYAE